MERSDSSHGLLHPSLPKALAFLYFPGGCQCAHALHVALMVLPQG